MYSARTVTTHYAQEQRADQELTVTTLLVIDGDESAQNQLHQLGRSTDGVHVVSAMTGVEGLRLARTAPPDLILIDTQLQDQDWLGVLRTLHEECQDTPVSVITACESLPEAVQAFRAGASDYVTKPLDLAEFDRAVKRGLQMAVAQSEQGRLADELKRITQRLRRQQEELNAVHDIGRLTTSFLDLDLVFERLSEIALHMTEADESVVLLKDDDREPLSVRARKVSRKRQELGLQMPLDGAAVDQAVRSGEPVVVANRQAQDSRGSAAETLLYVPLRAPDQVIGLLAVSGRRGKASFSEQDLFLLSTLGDYAAIAIQNARLFEHVAESRALMDSVFSSIASGVLTLDTEGQISLINRAAQEVLQTPDAAAGTSLTDVCPTMERSLQPLIETAREQRQPIGPSEVEVSLPSGQSVTLRASVSPLGRETDPVEGVTIVFDDLTRQRKLESRFRLFQRYLSPSVIERLPDDPEELKLGGVRREIACLFADLRGFVEFGLQNSPETLMETLNRYLGIGAEAVLAQEGTLDKFVGDAIVAFFNAPLTQERYVLRAVRAAVRIREATTALHAHLEPEERLTYGMGVTVGEAIVGNVGTPQRLDYTAIGPNVNLASRLQSAAKPGQILITPEVYSRTRNHVIARPIALDHVVGPEGPVRAYEVVTLS